LEIDGRLSFITVYFDLGIQGLREEWFILLLLVIRSNVLVYRTISFGQPNTRCKQDYDFGSWSNDMGYKNVDI